MNESDRITQSETDPGEKLGVLRDPLTPNSRSWLTTKPGRQARSKTAQEAKNSTALGGVAFEALVSDVTPIAPDKDALRAAKMKRRGTALADALVSAFSR